MRTENQPSPADLHREARRLEQVRRLKPAQPVQLDAVRAERQRERSRPDYDSGPEEAA